ncbi:MAG TPA: FmdB family zinc ribbon protein [Thermoanaerobaculia bacterium]|jgi:putative FmdB family regulatory protein|nr:FmdB family zinc ribbon protein [Thermoanaerobaculia bacterium]
MPIYEYQCLQCGTRTEHLQKFSDPPLPACPKCGGEVKKLISSPAFQFKGSGFYATDYAGKSGAKTDSSPAAETKSDGAKSEGGTSSSAETKSESKAESKTEAKPEKKETAAKGD